MGRGTGKLTRSVLKRTEELRGHPPVDMEGALSASAHSEVVAPRAGRGGTTSSNPLSSSSGVRCEPHSRTVGLGRGIERHRGGQFAALNQIRRQQIARRGVRSPYRVAATRRSYRCRLIPLPRERQHEREPTARDAGELAGYCCRAPPTSYSPAGRAQPARLEWLGLLQ